MSRPALAGTSVLLLGMPPPPPPPPPPPLPEGKALARVRVREVSEMISDSRVTDG